MSIFPSFCSSRNIARSLFALALFFPVAASAQPKPAGERLMPLDPLSATEKRDAERIARADSRVKELLGAGRSRLIYVDFFALKPENPKAAEPGGPLQIGRHAEVVFYRFEGDEGVSTVVDLGKGAVLTVSRLNSAEVPLNTDDLSEAFALALRSDELRKILGADAGGFQVERAPGAASAAGRGNVVRALRVQASAETDPCWKHRCAQLFFRRGDVFLTTSVVVDLTSQQVHVERGQR